MEIIKTLFFDYQQSEEYTKAFRNMPRKNDVQTAYDTFVDSVFKKDFREGDRLDCILMGALTAMEDFGFTQGFKYAMRLRNECNISGGETV